MRLARTVVLAAVLSLAIPAHAADEHLALAPGVLPECRAGDPLANVHHPGRLEVVKPCIAVTGTVVRSYLSPDGDIKINLKLDPADEHLLNQVNRDDQDGTLICEIVPADQPGCIPGERVQPRLGIIERFSQAIWGSYDFGICTGANVETPADGARVRVVGPHVIDHGHGWMEIHPVWAIEAIGRTGDRGDGACSSPLITQRPRPVLERSRIHLRGGAHMVKWGNTADIFEASLRFSAWEAWQP